MTKAKDESASAERELMKACECLYLEVPKSIADDVKQKAVAALHAAARRGAEDAAKILQKHIRRVKRHCIPAEFCSDFAFEATKALNEIRALKEPR